MRDRVRRPATTVGRRALLLSALLSPAVLVLAGCSIGDIRRTPPQRTVASADPTAPTSGPGAVEVRPMPVPAGYDAPFIAFDDADHGYAFYHGCNAQASVGVVSGCPSLLYATADGGRSWQHREHPDPAAAEHSMLVGYGSLVLAADATWYRSVDGGVTFTRGDSPDGSMPPEFASWDGPYQVCCQTDPVPRVVEVTEQGTVPLAPQPPIPVVQTVGHIGDKLTVAGLHDGRLHVAFGAPVATDDDGGGGPGVRWLWRTDAVTVADPERIRRFIVETTPSGGYWLIGEPVPLPGEFPLVWRADWGRLEPVPVHDPPPDVMSALPDGGRLLVTTRTGVWSLGSDGRFEPIDWPVQGAYLTRLRDATVQAVRPDGAVLLNVRQPSGAGWVEISWEPYGR